MDGLLEKISGEYSDFNEAAKLAGLNLGDVAECISAGNRSGDYAETSVVAVLRMKDGRFALLTGWCDTTGWGCQDGGSVQYADTQDAVMRLLSDDDREILEKCAVA